jgi:hypothetical protein
LPDWGLQGIGPPNPAEEGHSHESARVRDPETRRPRPAGQGRAGKLIELDLAEGTSDEEITEMCRKLLANTVIENFRIEKLEKA